MIKSFLIVELDSGSKCLIYLHHIVYIIVLPDKISAYLTYDNGQNLTFKLTPSNIKAFTEAGIYIKDM